MIYKLFVFVSISLLSDVGQSALYPCVDRDTVCPWLKSQGYCERQFAEWMERYCTKTCGKCGVEDPRSLIEDDGEGL